MTIDKLNLHYSFTSPATVHDEEAMTSLELAGRQGAKINEIIEDQNQLHEETSQALVTQKAEHDKMLNETMPQTVKNQVNAYVQSGVFDDEINRYARDLEGRLDSLIGKMPEGVTTSSMDAEIIDARTDFKGTTWNNVGKHIRETTNLLNTNVNNLLTDVFTQLTVNDLSGWYGAPPLGSSNAGWHLESEHHISINVVAGETYLVKCGHGWSMAGVIFLKSDGSYLGYDLHTSGGPTYHDYAKRIIIPEGCATLVVQGIASYPLGARKLTGTRPIIDDTYITNIVESVAPTNAILEEVSGTQHVAKLIYEGKLIDYTQTDNQHTDWTVTELAVTRGERYRISGSATHGNDHFMLVDDFGTVLSSVKNQGDAVPNFFEYDITIPPNGKTLFVSGYAEGQVEKIQKVKGGQTNELSLSHVKWVCLGDSLTEENIRTSKHYFDYVQDKTGVNVVNMGRSGTGYKNTEESGYAFYQRALDIPTDANVVTIFGSGNDLSHTLGNPTDSGTSTICGCVNKTIENILSINPTIKIGIVAPTPWNGNEPSDNGSMSRYSEALKEIAKMHGLPFLDLFHESGLRPNDATFRTLAYSKDDGHGVHPDETGHKMISGQFYVFIQKLVGTY